MRARFLLQSSICFLLLLGLVMYAGRIAEQLGGWSVDLGGMAPATLDDETVALLRHLDAPLSITYFATPAEGMPSRFRRVESQVRSLLGALHRAAPGRVSYRVVYPGTGGAAGAAYAAARGVSPLSVAHIRHDEHDERMIWSTLALERGGARPALINGITPEHISELEGLIRAHLQIQMQAPRPLLALAAPPGYSGLERRLAEYGEVLRVDLDGQTAIPGGADVLFWIQPRHVTPGHSRSLADFVASGRSVVLAGSAFDIRYLDVDEQTDVTVVAQPGNGAWQELLRPLGLSAVPDLLLDQGFGPLQLTDRNGQLRSVENPLQLRCLPAYCDMRAFAAPAMGALSFVGASALEIDAVRARGAGYRVQSVATTTDAARVIALPTTPTRVRALETGQLVGRRNLMVLLRPEDPLGGLVTVLAAPSLFRDDLLEQPGYAHVIFLRNLARTLTAPDRMALTRGRSTRIQAVGPVSDSQRVLWRVLNVGLVPALLLLLGAGGLLRRGKGVLLRGALRVGAGVAATIVVLGTLAYAAGAWRLPQWDLTADSTNRPSALLRDRLERHRGALQAELFVSPRAALPAELKTLEALLAGLLRNHDIGLAVRHPEHMGPAALADLAQDGLTPLSVAQIRHDSPVTRQVWCGLRLGRGQRTALIPHLDGRALRHLEFLLAAAVERLEHADGPAVAVVGTPPRLSPAEAMEDYQRKGLIPPTGADVYSQLKQLLTDYGYQIRFVDPREPSRIDTDELLLWLQPRRDSTPVSTELARHLHAGGRAMVALQHYRIQQRQYRGAGFETVYWPQPQFQDLDPFLKKLGVWQVREVLMDRTQSHLRLETQINRTAVREYDPQQVALPFLIRAVAANYRVGSPLTRHLGDLLFIWGNRFLLDRARLGDLGLECQEMVTTSREAWSYDWRGGWLPPEAFAPRLPWAEPQPLIVHLAGPFPLGLPARDETGRTQWEIKTSAPPGPAGDLLLVGCSEMFTDEYLVAANFDHEQLLLNAVAWLTYGPDLAELQARSTVPRGFPRQSAAAKAAWRLIAVGAGSLAFAMVGLTRRRGGRRSPA